MVGRDLPPRSARATEHGRSGATNRAEHPGSQAADHAERAERVLLSLDALGRRPCFRNVSLQVTRELMKTCHWVTVTDNRDAADYVLRISPGSSILYQQNGDVALTCRLRALRCRTWRRTSADISKPTDTDAAAVASSLW